MLQLRGHFCRSGSGFPITPFHFPDYAIQYKTFFRRNLEFITQIQYYITKTSGSMGRPEMADEEAFLAKSEYYFTDPACPIAVRRVAAANAAQHRFDLTVEPHRHDFAELVIVTSGGGIQMVDNTEVAVGAGEVFLIRGQTIHFFRERNRIGLVNVQFDPARLPLPLEWLRKLAGYNALFAPESAAVPVRLKLGAAKLAATLEIAGRLERELADPLPGSAPAALALLLELIVFIARCHGAPPVENPAAAKRVGRAVALIESEYFRPWTLAELARLCATSPNNLLRLFREAVGTTPVDYLIRVRLRHAAELLSRGSTVSEAAESCGFRDSNYFSRKFRAARGVSPREYRNGR